MKKLGYFDFSFDFDYFDQGFHAFRQDCHQGKFVYDCLLEELIHSKEDCWYDFLLNFDLSGHLEYALYLKFRLFHLRLDHFIIKNERIYFLIYENFTGFQN